MTPPPSLHSLSPELSHAILTRLSARDLSSAAAVSTAWRRHAQDDHVWRQHAPHAPPGEARRHHLRAVAWRVARANHTLLAGLPAPVAALRLVPGGLLLASLERRAAAPSPLPNVQIVCPTRTAWPDLSAPVCVSVKPHAARGLVYVAYAYPNGAALVYAASPATPSDATPILAARLLPLAAAARTKVTCVDVDAETLTLAVGTTRGTLVTARHGRPSAETPVTRFAARCIHVGDGRVVVGSDGGEVVCVHADSRARKCFVGPCSCPVTSVACAQRTVVAGFAHCVPGNGHTAGAVAWDRVSGSRLAAFGGGVPRSSSAFPTAAVRRISVCDGRIALLVGGAVRVYEIGSWRCVVEADLGDGCAMDMDAGRVAVACGRDGMVVVHILDFEQGISRWPKDVPQFKPDEGVLRDLGT